ncbi:MAG TPA: hypothetical protein VMF03_09290, partial [Steroidobacteraceae bacterium]|nr:hypothetical protein [Steroidobacteraceae bacterium]
MKGIVHAARLLLAWSAMTRWLLGIGLLLTVLGLGGLVFLRLWTLQPLFNALTVIGAITATISPVSMSAIVLRSLSVPRALRIIPHARLQLFLGALTTQLLLAAFIAGVIDVMIANRSGFAAIFVGVFALLTLQFIGAFAVAPLRLGMFWLLSWAVWPRL